MKTTLKSFFSGTHNRFEKLKKTVKVFHDKRRADADQSRFPARAKHPTSQNIVLDIPSAAVARTTLVIVLILALCFFLYQISGVLVTFFVSFLFAAALDPVVDYFQQYKIPRGVSVLGVYLFVLLLFGLLISNIVPLLAQQIFEIGRSVSLFLQNISSHDQQNFPFAQQLRPFIDQLYQAIDLKTAASQIQNALTLVGTQLLSISLGLMNILLVLILTFFMTIEEKALRDFYLSLFPSRYGEYISTRLEAVKEKIGYWLRGQLLISIAAAVLSYVGLLILGIDYALTLSVIAGITMLIPIFGRVFAWIFALPVVLNQSPLLALWLTIYYFGLSQIENNILVPYIMNKAVGLSPIIIIFAMLVGYQYLGVLGLVISIPIATSIAIFVRDYLTKEK